MGNLISIVNDGAIRLSNLVGFNDPMEYSYYAKSILKNKESESLYRTNTYVLSGSSKEIVNSGDILSQWRLYGHDGDGAIIKLKISNVQKFFSFRKIVYGLPTLELFHYKHKDFCQKHQTNIDYDRVLRYPALYHKNELYAIEKEARLAFFDNTMFGGIRLNIKSKSQFSKYGDIVKYVTIPLYTSDATLPHLSIESIEIGFKNSEAKFQEISKTLQQSLHQSRKEFSWDQPFSLPDIIHSNLINVYR